MPESGQRQALATAIGVAAEHLDIFAPAMCRYRIGKRVEIVSYDINAVVLPPAAGTGPDPRYPLPLILVDGAPAGRLPAHAPAELPLSIELRAGRSASAELPPLCLMAQTDAEGDPPRYGPLAWQDGAYRTSTEAGLCPGGQQGDGK